MRRTLTAAVGVWGWREEGGGGKENTGQLYGGSHTCSTQHGTGFRAKTLVFLTLRLSGEFAWWRASTTQWEYLSYSTPFTNRSLACYKDVFGDRISNKNNCFWKRYSGQALEIIRQPSVNGFCGERRVWRCGAPGAGRSGAECSRRSLCSENAALRMVGSSPSGRGDGWKVGPNGFEEMRGRGKSNIRCDTPLEHSV